LFQAASKQKSLGLWLLALVSVGLAYDNASLGIGAMMGAGDSLLQLNIVRFALHAVATPLMMIAGLTLARNASVNWTWRRSMSILVYVTTLSCIAYGVNEYLTGAAFKIADSGVLRYVLAESHGPPFRQITTMTFLIAFGIALYIEERSWWLLAGALTMFASATFQLGIIENIGEVLLMVSFFATAQKFTYINRAGYLGHNCRNEPRRSRHPSRSPTWPQTQISHLESRLGLGDICIIDRRHHRLLWSQFK
jgi:hypothetical protein